MIEGSLRNLSLHVGARRPLVLSQVLKHEELEACVHAIVSE